MKKQIILFPVEQPVGIFYIGKILTSDLLKIYYVNRRAISNDGIQRDVSHDRITQIKYYLEEPDAIFPTSIVLNISSSNINITQKQLSESVDAIVLEYDDENKEIAEVIDGQHRIIGLDNKSNSMKELPIVVLFDLTQEDKAHIFSVINSNQRQVNKSLIYDLFELYQGPNPIKFCHNIVKALNNDKNSPLFSRIKMLGKKNGANETVSQALFIDCLIKLVSSDPNEEIRIIKKTNQIPIINKDNLIFRSFFVNEQEAVLYRILFNYFTAIYQVFTKEWFDIDNRFILTKSTGVGALLKALPEAYKEGLKRKNLSVNFFTSLMNKTKTILIKENKELILKTFGLGEAAQNSLAKYFIDSWNNNINY